MPTPDDAILRMDIVTEAGRAVYMTNRWTVLEMNPKQSVKTRLGRPQPCLHHARCKPFSIF